MYGYWINRQLKNYFDVTYVLDSCTVYVIKSGYVLLKTADLFSPELGLAKLTLEDVQVCTIVLNSVKV